METKVIKLTTPWNHNYYPQIPTKNKFNNFSFEINNECKYADYWFIWGGVKKTEKTWCNPNNVFFLTEEANPERTYKQKFLNQFHNIVTCRTDIVHDKIIKYHDLSIWYFNKSYPEIRNMNCIKKNKNISLVSSDLTLWAGHKKRFSFVNKLMGHFKNRIDYFGRGINPITNKLDALLPYKFSIAIENNSHPDYFTEKIIECYLTNTVPVYFGCPNITDYFSPQSFIQIDINNFESSISIIENIISNGNRIYEQMLPEIINARNLCLEQYHFFPSIVNIIKLYGNTNIKNKKKIIISPEHPPANFFISQFKKIYNNLK